jgi:hypothetical protein
MSGESKPYWFPAKRRGWGWGPPSSAAGWIFLIAWLLIDIGFSPFLAMHDFPSFIAFTVGMIAILLAVCFIKGEPPKWR